MVDSSDAVVRDVVANTVSVVVINIHMDYFSAKPTQVND